MSHEKNYEVGYGNPPQATRFSSSNQPLRRRGRKPYKNPFAALLNALFAPIEVTEHGRTRKMSKLEVGMCQFANKVAKGDPKALNTALGILLRPWPVYEASDVDVSKAKSEDAKRSLHDLVLKLAQAELLNRSEGRLT